MALLFCGIALLLLSVRVIFSKSHSFLQGHACKGVPERERTAGIRPGANEHEQQ